MGRRLIGPAEQGAMDSIAKSFGGDTPKPKDDRSADQKVRDKDYSSDPKGYCARNPSDPRCS